MTEEKEKFRAVHGKWYKVCEHKPVDYDLVLLRDYNGRTELGWWTLQSWDGLKVHKMNEIVEWKKPRSAKDREE